MGSWDTTPWGSDDAADWFEKVFQGTSFDLALDAIYFSYIADEAAETEGKIRAAAYLLQCLGRVYVWPGNLDRLSGHLRRMIWILEGMTMKDSPAYESLAETWGHDAPVFESIYSQIDELKARLSKIQP